MKNKLILLLIVMIFIILILTAALLYDRLGSGYEPGLVVTQSEAEKPSADSQPEAEAPAAQEQPSADSQPEADAAAPSEETEAEEPASVPAPDFTVLDASGAEVTLSGFRGKPVILNFWASWCGPCKSEMPAFEEAYLEYGDRIEFVLVNLTDGYQETVETASQFISSMGYTFPIYFDTAYEASSAYGVSAVPVTYFIDADGAAIAMGQGALSSDALQSGIDLLLPQE